MKRKIVYGAIGAVVIVTALIITVVMINAKPLPIKNSSSQNIVFVKAQKVAEVETETNMSYRGRVTAFDEISLAAEVQGRILQGDVRFKTGESFRKGDTLVRIYSRDVETTLKAGKSTLLQTLSEILPDIKVDFPLEYEKWDKFFNNIDTEVPLPGLPKINTNKEKVFLSANNVLSNYYNLQKQEINLLKYTIIAPFDGTFKSVSKEIGAIASPGSELATIIRLDKLEITVPVFPGDLAWINTGDRVTVTDGREGRKTARVSRISDFVDEASQMVSVFLAYDNIGNGKLLQGEYVDVEFKVASIKGFEIPREALVDNSSVYELKDKQLVQTSVKILRKLEDAYIISGIDTTKIIVTESITHVNPSVEYKAR